MICHWSGNIGNGIKESTDARLLIFHWMSLTNVLDNLQGLTFLDLKLTSAERTIPVGDTSAL